MSNTQKWLVARGAGYIGSHVADDFLADGKEVVVCDFLDRGLTFPRQMQTKNSR